MKTADLARLLLLSALWGGSFIFMRVAAPVLGPFLLIESRVLIAGLTLLAYASFTRQPLQLRRFWKQYLVIGGLNSALPFVLIASASIHLTASLTAILNATTPLFGALMAALWLHDPLTLRKIAGILLGVAGVGILTGLSVPALTPLVLLSIGASLAAALSYGSASVYMKSKASTAPAIGMTVGSQLAASLWIAPAVPFTLPSQPPTLAALLSTLGLALLSTALAYILFFRLVVNVGPLKTLTVTFLAPIFGMLWSALFLGDPITWGKLLGCAVIFAGTALVTGVRLPAIQQLTRLRND